MNTELNPADIRWRVSNTWDREGKKWGMLVGYIDARTCMEALDSLDENWSAVHGDPIVVGNELIGVPVSLTVNGVTRSDVGMPSSQEPIKGAYSDALKRAAVHFGIGRELYELPKIAVECEVGSNGKVKAPKALPIYRNGRWDIDRKVGWVKYDREPDEQPQGGEREASTGKREQPARTHPAVRTPEEQALADELLRLTASRGRPLQEELADEVGVPKGMHANVEQLRAMILLAVEKTATDTSAAARAADQDGIPLPSEELSDASGVVPDPAGAPPVPPELQERIDKARSRGKKADEPVQESLLGEPVA